MKARVASAIAFLLAIAPAMAVGITWEAVANYGSAIGVHHNSHATAGAWIAKRHGLKKPVENDRQFVSVAWVYMQHCECNKPGKPKTWRVAEGLAKMFEGRGKPVPTITERVRHSSVAAERVGWDRYVAAIDADRPVIVTFCYDPDTRSSLAEAKRRASNCFSVVGIGYMDYGGQKLLICHDGTGDPAEMGMAVQDRVSPQAMGINTTGKPWGQAGTCLMKWDGTASNIVLVFTGD